ncbi:MmgE/PrpD family protein [Paraburkholderia sp. SIMBA_054]|uniref:MmgE/PrpD family protein n=1 Tax=Paraburkholderia sp. SIMBA_054 TaxID=3085795 RepID=UPI0039787382
MESKDLSHEFASYISACRFEDLPADAIEAAKKSILDVLGVCLAASGSVPAIQSVVEIVRESGGQPECSILGFGDRAPPLMAAFANGAMAHCLDFDDMGPDGNHSSSYLIPAVFAAAEHVGGISGKQLISAVAIGQDLFFRTRRSLQQRLDWLVTTVLGVFSATAAVAYVLRLNKEQVANALGIASLGSCGTLEMRFGTNSDLGELYAGFVAKSAVLSAWLAQKGVTGTQSVFEGKAGVMNVYFQGEYDRARILNGLGSRFEGSTIQYKPWPTCGISHTYIHATLELIRKHELKAGDIAEIRPYVGDFAQQMSYPLEARRRPASAMDARFSIPFCLAAAAVYGEMRIRQFTADGLRDEAVLAAAQKVVPVDDPGFDWKGDMPNARVDIVTKSGAILTGSGEGTPGGKDRPMDWDLIGRKFSECASLAANPISAAVSKRAVEMAKSLDQMDDSTELIKALA